MLKYKCLEEQTSHKIILPLPKFAPLLDFMGQVLSILLSTPDQEINSIGKLKPFLLRLAIIIESCMSDCAVPCFLPSYS